MKSDYRVRFVLDPDGTFEECNGKSRPLTETEYADHAYCRPNGETIPYAEYLDYYGNPDRHVYVQCDVQHWEVRADGIGRWTYETGLGGIDLMDDSEELAQMDRWYTPDEAIALRGYLRDVAIDCLSETDWEAPKHLYCRRRSCTNFHVDGADYCVNHGGLVIADVTKRLLQV